MADCSTTEPVEKDVPSILEMAAREQRERSIAAVPMEQRMQTTPSKWPEPLKRTSVKSNCSPSKDFKRRRTRLHEKVATFVFMDLETTGIFKDGGGYGPRSSLTDTVTSSEQFSEYLNHTLMNTSDFPRITEMSFLTVDRETFVDYQEKMRDTAIKNPEASVRMKVACNVHTRQVNPCLTNAEWAIYEASRNGTKKEYLVHARSTLMRKNTFETEWPAVVDFLKSCPKPACIVAHNGVGFDYRVLYGEIKRAKLLETHGIPDDVLFVDSWCMVKHQDERYFTEIQNVTRGINWNMISKAVTEVKLNENGSGSQNELSGTAQCQDPKPAEQHPMDFLDKESWCLAKIRRIKPNFFKLTNSGRWDFSKYSPTNTLKAIYADVVKGGYDFHYAQDDAEALMQVCIAFGEDFTKYADLKSADFPF